MYTLIMGIIVLGVLVFVHELGHFTAAKALGVRVLKFSLGFGPRLVGFKRRGTDYVIAAFPMGGYVKMAGENPESGESTGAPDEFLAKPWWARMVIALAGPAMNLVFAFVACSLMYVVGIRYIDFESVVGKVQPGSLAAQYGFSEGDRVLKVDGTDVKSWTEFMDKLMASKADLTASVLVEGARGRLDVTVRLADRAAVLKDLTPVSSPPVVGSVTAGLPGYERGLKPGDRIVSVDGVEVQTWEQLAEMIHRRPDREVALVIQRDDARFEQTVTPVKQEVEGLGEIGFIGISPRATAYGTVRAAGVKVLALGASSTVEMVGQAYAGLFRLVLRPSQIRRSIAGPVTIVQMSGDQARRGLGNLLYFVAFVSIALVVVNLLPIPIMDGGHVMFCLVEGLRGKALSMSKQLVLQRIGLAIVGTLILFSFWVDFARIVQRGRATLGKSVEVKGGSPGEPDTAGAVKTE
ncbi:MAG: RIP metalloprotease RseP [Candidatus Eisenbacteria bacterium]|nr:RIP metalloprotease RseP [Candidatus Eisenbacteria bacterium]